MLVRVVMPFVSVFLFFATVELFLRVIHFEEVTFSPSGVFQAFLGKPTDSQMVNGDVLRDAELFWRMNPKRDDDGIWSQGFREIKTYPIEKPVDILRIVCLGDSVPYGIGVSVYESYPKILEKILNYMFWQKIEVVNAGMPGYSSFQCLRYLKRDLLKYQPDLLLVHVGPNDRAAAVYFADKEQPRSPQWIVDMQNTLGRFQTYSLLSRIIFYFRYKFWTKPLMKPRVSFEDYRKNLADIVELGRNNGFQIIFLPSLRKDKKGLYQLLPLPEKSMAVDSLRVFQENQKNAPLFLDECHLTVSGNQLMANTIAEFLLKNNLLTKKRYS